MKIENSSTVLSKPNRLTEEKDFKRVMQKGRAFFVMELGIKVYPQKNREAPTRIGIVVPKKLARTIVKRNRIKRQLRHIFIPLIAEIAPGYDIICLARAPLMDAPYQKMRNQVHFALQKLNLLQRKPPILKKNADCIKIIQSADKRWSQRA